MKNKNFKAVSFSAPAKIHLIGEHSAVYGKPAILSAINLRLYVTLTPTKKPQKPIAEISKLKKTIERKIQTTFKIKKIPNYAIEIDSQFPIGSGLGSSAALSAALTAAILTLLGQKHTKEDIFKIALEGERLIHQNPSGGDLAIVIYGGTLYFRKEFEGLTFQKPLALKSKIQLVLINSGKPAETTGQMVKFVASQKPQIRTPMIENLEILTKEFCRELLKPRPKFEKTIKLANRELAKLNVVSPAALEIISKIQSVKGVAKITGAGGRKENSGIIISYHSNLETITKLAKRQNWQTYKVKLDQEGLKQEK